METVSFVIAGQGSRAILEKLRSYRSYNVTSAKMLTIDYIVSKLELRKIDFIKLDVESSEVNAIASGVKTITKHRPKMAICVYHKSSDLYDTKRWMDIFNYSA